MAKVKFKRKTTEEIENLEIEDGSLIYDIETGKTYMDYDGERISTGGGNSGSAGIYISETEPTEEDASLWINPTNSIAKYKINDEWVEVGTEQVLLETSQGDIPTTIKIEDNILNNIGTEVVDSLEGNQTNKAPSVRAINNYNKVEDITDSVIITKTEGNGELTSYQVLKCGNVVEMNLKFNTGSQSTSVEHSIWKGTCNIKPYITSYNVGTTRTSLTLTALSNDGVINSFVFIASTVVNSNYATTLVFFLKEEV